MNLKIKLKDDVWAVIPGKAVLCQDVDRRPHICCLRDGNLDDHRHQVYGLMDKGLADYVRVFDVHEYQLGEDWFPVHLAANRRAVLGVDGEADIHDVVGIRTVDHQLYILTQRGKPILWGDQNHGRAASRSTVVGSEGPAGATLGESVQELRIQPLDPADQDNGSRVRVPGSDSTPIQTIHVR